MEKKIIPDKIENVVCSLNNNNNNLFNIIEINKNIFSINQTLDFYLSDDKIKANKQNTYLIFINLKVKKLDTLPEFLILNIGLNKYILYDLDKDNHKYITYNLAIEINNNDEIFFNSLKNIKIKGYIHIIPYNQEIKNNSSINKDKMMINFEKSAILCDKNILKFNNNFKLFNVFNNYIILKDEGNYKVKLQLEFTMYNELKGYYIINICSNNNIIKYYTIPLTNIMHNTINLSSILYFESSSILTVEIFLTTNNIDDDGMILLPDSYIQITKY